MTFAVEHSSAARRALTHDPPEGVAAAVHDIGDDRLVGTAISVRHRRDVYHR